MTVTAPDAVSSSVSRTTVSVVSSPELTLVSALVALATLT